MRALPFILALGFSTAAPLSARAQDAEAKTRWSVCVSMEDRGDGSRKEIIAGVRQHLGQVPQAEWLQYAERVEVRELVLPGREGSFDSVVDLHVSERVPESFWEKLRVDDARVWETIEGAAVAQLPTRGRPVWVAVPDRGHVVTATSREAIEWALKRPAAGGGAAKMGDGEVVRVSADLGAIVPVKRVRESELLELMKGVVELKLSVEAGAVAMEASAQLPDAKSAKRARRILDGMVASFAAENPDLGATPLDERLEFFSEESTLKAKATLYTKEVQGWLDALAKDFEEAAAERKRRGSKKGESETI